MVTWRVPILNLPDATIALQRNEKPLQEVLDELELSTMNTQTSMPCSTYNPSWALPIVDETDCAACRPLKTSPTSSQTSLIVETPQCTDKCIVVACDQPDHQDLDEIFGACSSGQCEAVCDIAHEPLEWPCAEPNCQMKEMVSRDTRNNTCKLPSDK